MSKEHLSTLRFFSLLFLLPGLAGLITSAIISTHYLDTLPRTPVAAELRMTPRNVHGIIIYQTEEENRKLNLIEYSSVGTFLVGLGMGLVYIRKWGIARALEAEDDEFVAEES
jgi:uncharacterized membrane-anchored protein YitT (DUF2179 family)